MILDGLESERNWPQCEASDEAKRSSNSHDTYERLPEIKVPTLAISGDADRIFPVDCAPPRNVRATKLMAVFTL